MGQRWPSADPAAVLTFGHVPPPFRPELWDAAQGLLQTALQRGGYNWAELEEELADGRAQLWLTLSGKFHEPIAAMVTRMDGDTLEVWLAGGVVMSGSIPFLETAIEASKAAGTTNGRITGRRGWQRVLRPYGWRPQGDDLVKDWTA
jgi:hypothetical protein